MLAKDPGPARRSLAALERKRRCACLCVTLEQRRCACRCVTRRQGGNGRFAAILRGRKLGAEHNTARQNGPAEALGVADCDVPGTIASAQRGPKRGQPAGPRPRGTIQAHATPQPVGTPRTRPAPGGVVFLPAGCLDQSRAGRRTLWRNWKKRPALALSACCPGELAGPSGGQPSRLPSTNHGV